MLDPGLFINEFLPTKQDVVDLVNGKKGPTRPKPMAYLYGPDHAPKPIPFPIEQARPNNMSKWVVSCQVSSNKAQDVPMQMDLKLREIPGIERFDTERDLVGIECAFTNRKKQIILQVPVGLFGFDFPDRELHDSGNFWTVKGFDPTRRVARLGAFLNSYCPPAGYLITDVVKAMLMADMLPPVLPGGLPGGRQPSGVAWTSATATQGLPPPVGSPGSTDPGPFAPYVFGPYGFYSPNGVRVDDVGTPVTVSGQPMLQLPNGDQYPTQSGARVDAASHVPIDPWTGASMAPISAMLYQSSRGTLYSTKTGTFIQTGASVESWDVFRNAPATWTYRSWNGSAYVGYPLPLYTWPYDYDGSGPYFVTAASQSTTTIDGSTGAIATGPAFPVEDARSGAVDVSSGWNVYGGSMVVLDIFQTPGTAALGTAQQYPLYGGIGLMIDPKTGYPWDPVSNNGPMTPSTFSGIYLPTYGWLCSNGCIFDGVNFRLPGADTAAFCDPTTLEASSTFTLTGLTGYGTSAVTTVSTATAPTIVAPPFPWPDTNNPGLTPSGCPHVGPNIPASQIVCTPSDVTLPYSVPFGRKENEMAAINSLLTAINYWGIFPDQYGRINIAPTPYNSTTNDFTAYQLPPEAWLYDTTDRNTIKTGVTVTLGDASQMANVIIVLSENNKTKPVIAVAYNMNTNSRYSIPNLGYAVVKLVQDDKIVGSDLISAQQIATDRAVLELNLAATATEGVTFESGIVPFTGVHDFPRLNVTTPDGKTYEVDSRFYQFEETAWTIDFSTRSMQHTLARLVLI